MSRNKITISSTTEDLHDARLPDTLGTAGQVPKINSAGTGFEYGDAGGGRLYCHSITLQYNQHSYCYLNIVNNTSTPFTKQTLCTWLYDNVQTSYMPYTVSGQRYNSTDSTYAPFTAIFSTSSGYYFFLYIDPSAGWSYDQIAQNNITSFNTNVIQIQ